MFQLMDDCVDVNYVTTPEPKIDPVTQPISEVNVT